MYCKSCGKIIDNDSKFCIHCGTKLFSEKEPSFEKVEQKNSVSDPIEFYIGEKVNKKILNPIYDTNYQKETGATIFGILLLIVGITIYLIGPITFRKQDTYNDYLTFSTVISLIIRIIASFWVDKIAKRQNRNSTVWAIFAFFIPSIALIIIGQTKKIFLEKPTNISKDNADNISHLHNSIIKEKKENISKQK